MSQIGRYFDVEFESLVVEPKQAGSQASVLDLFEPGIHFLLGKNGAGKSRLIDSISAFSSSTSSAFQISVIGKLPSPVKLTDLKIAIDEFIPDPNRIENESSQRYSKVNPTLLNCIIDSFWERGRVFQEPFTFFSEKEILEFFGLPKEDIDKWERYFKLNIEGKIENGSHIYADAVPNFKESFDLADHKCQIFLAWLSSSKINFKENYHHPVPLTDSTNWIESKEKKALVLEAFMEFIASLTHVEIYKPSEGEGKLKFFRLLASPPAGGRVSQIMAANAEETKSLEKHVQETDTETWQDSDTSEHFFPIETDTGFPFDLYQYSRGWERNLIASISVPLREDLIHRNHFIDAFEILGFHDSSKYLSDGIENSLASHLEEFHRLTSSDDDTEVPEIFIFEGFEESEKFLETLSNHVSKIPIGISRIVAEKPLLKKPFWREDPFELSLKPKLFLIDSQSNDRFEFSKASSGQKDVIAILFWLSIIKNENCLIAIAALDEFDRHLQSSAAEKLLHQIDELSKEKNLTTIVSTHRVPQFSSSAIRKRPRIFVHKNIANQPLFTQSESIPTEVATELLGVHANEALNLKKVRILVEGTHDAMIIRHLIETTAGLHAEEADIISAIGSYQFQSLWKNRFTRDEIPLLIIHDKRNLGFELAFRRAQELADKPGARERIWIDSGLMEIDLGLYRRNKMNKGAGRRMSKGDPELKSLMFLTKEILGYRYQNFHGKHQNTCTDLHSLKKVEIFGLDCEDIVDLLPITAFPKAKQYGNWATARSKSNALDGEAFKKNLQINESSVARALNAINDNWDPELTRLYTTISNYIDPLSNPMPPQTEATTKNT